MEHAVVILVDDGRLECQWIAIHVLEHPLSHMVHVGNDVIAIDVSAFLGLALYRAVSDVLAIFILFVVFDTGNRYLHLVAYAIYIFYLLLLGWL